MKIMGILNTTPDSFSDGGRFLSPAAALLQAEQMISEGADIIDIGGESTRPYAEEVSAQEEMCRVLPVIAAIRARFTIPISIDTWKAEVAHKALQAGATIINDITAAQGDPEMIGLLAAQRCPVIIMHMQGTPRTMQDKPHYNDVVAEVMGFLQERIETLTEAGIAKERIILDPGIGFGKDAGHNLSLLKHLKEFKKLGCPLLLAHSRKSFIESVTGEKVEERDPATALVSSLAWHQDADIIRVHNVALNRKMLQITEAIASAE